MLHPSNIRRVVITLLVATAAVASAQDAGSSATRAETEPIWVARLFLIAVGDGEAAKAARVFHDGGRVQRSEDELTGEAITGWLERMVADEERFFVKANCVADSVVTIDAVEGTQSGDERPVRLVFHTSEGYIDLLEVRNREASELCDE